MKKCKRDSRPVRLREKLHRKKLRNSHAPWMQGGGRGGWGARESCEGEGWEVAGGWGVGWGKGGVRQRKDATYSALLISSSLSPPTLSFPLPSTYYPPYPNLYPLPSISCPLPLPYPPSPAHSAPLRPPCTGSASHGRAQPDYRYALES